MTRLILSLVVLFSLSMTAHGDFLMFYLGDVYEDGPGPDPPDPPYTDADRICGVFTFTGTFPPADGAITPLAMTLQTSESGGTVGGFSSSSPISTSMTWSGSAPSIWNVLVGNTDDTLQIIGNVGADGDTVLITSGGGIVTALNNDVGSWFTSLPAACSSTSHPAIAAVPEPSGFLFLTLLGALLSGANWFKRIRAT